NMVETTKKIVSLVKSGFSPSAKIDSLPSFSQVFYMDGDRIAVHPSDKDIICYWWLQTSFAVKIQTSSTAATPLVVAINVNQYTFTQYF
ncbi:hypothetical protein FRX31_005701, partial [Thalictrum thalictroides]